MILDGGAADIGIESTVLDVTASPPVILRPGWVTRAKISEVIGEIAVAAGASEEALMRSPGTRHRHYSPRARVVLVTGASPQMIEEICRKYLDRGPVGFIGHTRLEVDDARFSSVILGPTPADYARSIYDALRKLDELSPGVILVEGIGEGGEGAAVMDRLRRAASEVLSEAESRVNSR
jgi:L-threonylcarbamoyladenylate synthase